MSDLATNSKLADAAKNVGDRVQGHQMDRVPGYDPFDTVRHYAYGKDNESCSIFFAGKQPFQECTSIDDKGFHLDITPIFPHIAKEGSGGGGSGGGKRSEAMPDASDLKKAD